METRRLYDFIGVVLSTAIIATAIVLWTNYDAGNIRINEVGDYLAGIVSALALVWLVLGYRIQRHELGLQLKELKESTQAQHEQHEALLKQASALHTTSKALSEYTRPYVTANLEWDGHNFEVCVRNDGIRSAQSVEISFEPPLSEVSDERHDPATIHQHGYLPPGARVNEVLHYGPTMFGSSEYVEIQTSVSIEYLDEFGNTYHHSYPIHTSEYVENVANKRKERTSLHDIAESIGDPNRGFQDSLRKNVHKIANALERMSKSEPESSKPRNST